MVFNYGAIVSSSSSSLVFVVFLVCLLFLLLLIFLLLLVFLVLLLLRFHLLLLFVFLCSLLFRLLVAFFHDDLLLIAVTIIIAIFPWDLVAEVQAFVLELFEDFTHGFFVLTGLNSTGNELESLFNLVTEGVSKLLGGSFGETVDTRGDGTFVR